MSDDFVTHREMDQRFAQLERSIDEAKRVADRAHDDAQAIWKQVVAVLAIVTSIAIAYGWFK